MGRQSCLPTTGVPSPVPSVASTSTTRMSASTSSACRPSQRARPIVAVEVPEARANARKTRVSLKNEAKAKVKHKAKVEEAEALTGRTRTRSRTRGGQVRGKPEPYAWGDQPSALWWAGKHGAYHPFPKAQAQQEQGTKRANEDGDESNARKRSPFLRIAQKLRKKGFDVTCPVQF